VIDDCIACLLPSLGVHTRVTKINRNVVKLRAARVRLYGGIGFFCAIMPAGLVVTVLVTCYLSLSGLRSWML